MSVVNKGCTRWTCWEYSLPGGMKLWSWSCSCGLSLGESDTEPFDVHTAHDCVLSSISAHAQNGSKERST